MQGEDIDGRQPAKRSVVIPSGNAGPVRQPDGLVPWQARTEEKLTIVPAYWAGGSGIAFTPTRARYSSAWRRSFPARTRIFSRLSIEETSSSCSVRNHCKKLMVM